MPVSTHYSIQSLTVTNETGSQPDASMHPEHVTFVARMFLTYRHKRNLPIQNPTQIHA